MSQIIDRRPNSRHKSAVNRQRFINRFKSQIRKAVSDAVSSRNLTDIEQGEKINIPSKDTHEPNFRFGQGGKRDIILPGNQDFSQGDRLKRPPSSGGGQGDSQASESGEGNDEFAFQLSREEFLDIFFDDLELPNLVKKQIATTKANKWVRAGYTQYGTPTNINIVRSMKGAIARKLAIGSIYNKQISRIEQEIKELSVPKNAEKIKQLEDEIKVLKRKKSRIPYIDPFDLKYNSKVQQPSPATRAVMFCLMDVSGSMDETKKDIAKRFFILLYLFLNKNYEKIELVFIRHHTVAKEVDEQEFFYSRETGGTVVSSALELMHKIIAARFPANEWNIYAAQASDGDNWNNDSPRCREILVNNILPIIQYFAYIEIMPRHHQSLWEAYSEVQASNDDFSMQHIANIQDIYPVFRELFKREQYDRG